MFCLAALGRVYDAHQMGDLADHAADRRSIFQRARAVHFVQTQADQGLLLVLGPADRAAGP